MNNMDWIITVTNTENHNVDVFRFYGTTDEVRCKLQLMAQEDCQLSDLQADFSDNGRYLYQYQLVAQCDDGDVVYTATEFAAIDFV